MIRKKKRFSRPRKPFEINRIKEEDELIKKYGLKNKKEIWKSVAKINYFRTRAKALARSSSEEQEVLFNKLNSLGLKVETIADILGLKVEDLLNRRLPTVIVQKGLTNTVKQARQFVVHKKVVVNNQIINSPSYLVPVAHEKSIKLKVIAIKPDKKHKVEKVEEQQ